MIGTHEHLATVARYYWGPNANISDNLYPYQILLDNLDSMVQVDRFFAERGLDDVAREISSACAIFDIVHAEPMHEDEDTNETVLYREIDRIQEMEQSDSDSDSDGDGDSDEYNGEYDSDEYNGDSDRDEYEL